MVLASAQQTQGPHDTLLILVAHCSITEHFPRSRGTSQVPVCLTAHLEVAYWGKVAGVAGLGQLDISWVGSWGECTCGFNCPPLMGVPLSALSAPLPGSLPPWRAGACGSLNKSALSRSRRARSGWLHALSFMCPAAPASLASLLQRDFALLAMSKRYSMLKFNAGC